MIKITRINGKELVVNAELIEFIEVTPDTILSLTTGRKVIVLESIDEVINRITVYKRSILRPVLELRDAGN